METVKQEKKRYELLDAFRGILMIEMVIYHYLFDVAVFSTDFGEFFTNPAYYIFQQSIGWGFIFLSGMCVVFSKKMLKRGLTILGAAVIVSLVTYIFTPDVAINFGVLCCIGSCMLLMIPVKRISEKWNTWVAFAISFLLFLFCRNINMGYFGFESLNLFALPEFLYANYLTAYLGFPPLSFTSGDYYPLFPWFFLYMSGYFLFKGIYQKEKIKNILSYKIPGLSYLGKYSLLIYLLHQPVCYAVAFAVCKWM